MKPFNLQAALAGAKVVTVSGEPVTGLHWFEGVRDGFMNLFGVVDGEILSWHDNGAFAFDKSKASRLDLRMAEDDQS